MSTVSRSTTLTLAGVAVALWLTSAAAAAAAEKPAESSTKKKGTDKTKPGGTILNVAGQLTDKDDNDPVQNHPAKTYKVKLAKGKAYQIDMVSDDFDAYLRLEDSKGDEVAQDDDGGGGHNARIVVRPSATDTYKIVATSFDGGTGKFQLTLKEAVVAKAAKLTLQDGKAEVKGQLAKGDATDTRRANCFAKGYEVMLQGGKTYQIDMMSNQLDSFLRVENAGGKELAEDDDSGEGRNARIVFTCPEDGAYRVIATSCFPNATGGFTLSVREQ